jgi:hypothetical protein
MTLAQIIVSIATVIAASGVGWLTVRLTRAKLAAEALKLKSEAAAVLTDTAISLVAPLQTQVAELKEEVGEVHEEVKLVREENRLLRLWGRANYRRVEEMGGSPITYEEVFRKYGNGGVNQDLFNRTVEPE